MKKKDKQFLARPGSHTVVSRGPAGCRTKKHGLVALLLFCTTFGLYGQPDYFSVIEGIPHLPVFATTGSVPSPSAGMAIYSTGDDKPMLYTGSNWTDLCSASTFTANNGYFEVTSGIPVFPVKASATGTLSAGSMYLGTAANSKLQVYNGSGWADVEATGSLIAGTNGAEMGQEFLCPVRGTDPSPVGLTAGAFYLSSTSETLKWYDGSTWQVLSCSASYPAGTVHCIPGGAEIVDVTSPETGKTWMDRNLGASQVATSSTDANAYGDLYQWGRFSDGHQCRSSATTSTLATTAAPLAGNSWDGEFILSPSTPFDWLSPQDHNLWQGVNGINNPCPTGYRLPDYGEWNAERVKWDTNDSAGAYGSALKLTMAGYRYFSNGSISFVGSYGSYWSSSVDVINAWVLYFNSNSATLIPPYRANGLSVRCIKD